MKKYIIIFFLLLASASYAQPPRIDSMIVDEAKSELHIYGSFGSAQGNVTVDSVTMLIKSWTDTLIISSIPDTGKGSAGPVIVMTNGVESKKTMISTWTGYWSYMNNRQASLPENYGYALGFTIRMDLHSILRHSNNISKKIIPKKTSYVYGYCDEGFHGPCGIGYNRTSSKVYIQDTGIIYAHGFRCIIIYDASQNTFYSFAAYIKGIMGTTDSCGSKGPQQVEFNYFVPDFTSYFSLDSFFRIIPHDDTTNNFGHGFFEESHVRGSGPDFPPPQSAFALQSKPTLHLPLSGTVYIFNNITKLIWDSLSLMSSYHVQVSSDSLFKTSTIDTTITSFNFSHPTLTGLTRYFWRVAGVNSEGESRWSDVWDFWTGLTSADVQDAQNYKFTLSSFPNPSSKELNISYSLPENGNSRIILYDLQGRVIRETSNNLGAGEHLIQWDVSQFASGSYILGLITNKESKSQLITIIH